MAQSQGGKPHRNRPRREQRPNPQQQQADLLVEIRDGVKDLRDLVGYFYRLSQAQIAYRQQQMDQQQGDPTPPDEGPPPPGPPPLPDEGDIE